MWVRRKGLSVSYSNIMIIIIINNLKIPRYIRIAIYFPGVNILFETMLTACGLLLILVSCRSISVAAQGSSYDAILNSSFTLIPNNYCQNMSQCSSPSNAFDGNTNTRWDLGGYSSRVQLTVDFNTLIIVSFITTELVYIWNAVMIHSVVNYLDILQYFLSLHQSLTTFYQSHIPP